jgi:hypothetical protein
MIAPSASKTSITAVAVVSAIVAVLTVMAVPGISVGETTASQGAPGTVFMQRDPGTCAMVDGTQAAVMTLDITLDGPSHLLLYFTAEWGSLSSREEGLLNPSLDFEPPFEWGISGHTIPRTTSTVMWSFDNVSAGTHNVGVGARVEASPDTSNPPGVNPSSDLNECALTVFVIPVPE